VLLNSCVLCGATDLSLIEELNSNLHVYKCESCRIIFLNPRGDSSGYDYSEDFIDKWKKEKLEQGIFDLSMQPNLDLIESQYTEVLMPLRNVPSSQNILEIGSGPGLVMTLLRSKGFNIVGIEPSPNFADFARNSLSVDVETSGLFEYQPGKKFDIVILNSVIEHLPNPIEALVHIRKNFIKRNGSLIITAPNINSLEYLRDHSKWDNFNGDHFWYFSEKTLEFVLRKSGFSEFEWFRHNYELNHEMQLQLRYIKHYLDLEFNPYGGISVKCQF
jgi:2-polyprenyl-3-methyl-5-hydroxy-6-metoxy-1,4-benzoquinol methylase